MIWFWVPASLVIINDVGAYVCGEFPTSLWRVAAADKSRSTGMAFGRHQLIKLSPKKTVEGFVGAFFITILFAVAVRDIWFAICAAIADAVHLYAVGHLLHALQLHDLPRSGPVVQCLLRHPLHPQ